MDGRGDYDLSMFNVYYDNHSAIYEITPPHSLESNNATKRKIEH